MKRILLTGMSGTGKSTVLGELARLGYKTVDTDYGWVEQGPDGALIWQEEKIQNLLATEDSAILFVGGCVPNQSKFYAQFDQIILLSAPADVIVERLRTRTNNPFGKSPEELSQVLRDLEAVEPLLRRGASHEIDTNTHIRHVVGRILRLIDTDTLPTQQA